MRAKFSLHAVPAALTLLGLCLAPTAQAVTNTGNMLVSANIDAACTVSAGPMAFGTVLPGTDKDAQVDITSTCTTGTTYTVDVGDGENSITTGGTGIEYRRQMANATYRLPYVVYIDSTRATSIDATAVVHNNLLTSTVGDALPKTTTIYGRVVGAESAAKRPLIYTDTVVITIAF
jgi:spore coat protein U-like protein